MGEIYLDGREPKQELVFTRALPSDESLLSDEKGTFWYCYVCGHCEGPRNYPQFECARCDTDLWGNSKEDSFVAYYAKPKGKKNVYDVTIEWKHPLIDGITKNAIFVGYHLLSEKIRKASKALNKIPAPKIKIE